MKTITNYEEAKAFVAEIREITKQATAALHAIPGVGTGPMGLTPDDVKATPEYCLAKAKFEQAFHKERKVNAWFVKTFKKEYAAERRAKYASMVEAGRKLNESSN